MKRLNPEKLNVEFRLGVTTTKPIISRRYTLTHSDITGDLFLTIGLNYAYDKINEMRDEVLAEWKIYNGDYYFYVYVYIGDYGSRMNGIRDMIFRRELPLALEAMIYGDREFLTVHPKLNDAPIWIYFDSIDPNYNKFEYWGTIRDYN